MKPFFCARSGLVGGLTCPGGDLVWDCKLWIPKYRKKDSIRRASVLYWTGIQRFGISARDND